MDPSTLDAILSQGETRNVEIKGACGFRGDMRAHLATSVGAMANTPGGGTIVIGAENTTWAIQSLTAEQIASFDVTKIMQYLKERFAPLPRLTIVTVAHPDGDVLLIQVPEFEEIPILVTKQIADSKQKVYANEGDILIRSETRECRRINSADELRELLSRALRRRSELLLTEIRTIFTGVAPTPPATPPEELFVTALPDWPAALDEWKKQRPHCAWWEVSLLPIPPLARPFEAGPLLELIRSSAVSWRGWKYPTYGVRDQDFVYLQDDVRFAYDSDRFSERWQASCSGAFASAQVLLGDMVPQDAVFPHPPAPERVVSYHDIVYGMTEFFRFATSFAEGLGCEALWVRIALRNIDGRQLGSFDPSLPLWGVGTSSMRDVVQTHTWTRTELASTWRELALDWIMRILTVFQWPDADRSVLAGRQTRLIERRL
jgi:hypothetical protein